MRCTAASRAALASSAASSSSPDPSPAWAAPQCPGVVNPSSTSILCIRWVSKRRGLVRFDDACVRLQGSS
jgi:hypothetical protein